MLITFICNAHENITMFGEVAVQLIKMMGHSGTVPSAILAADVPAAFAQLTQAIDRGPSKSSVDDEDSEPGVSLRHRALPLIELLQAAAKEKCDVLWK